MAAAPAQPSPPSLQLLVFISLGHLEPQQGAAPPASGRST